MFSREREREHQKMTGGWRLLAADFVISLMWVWSGVLNKIFVHRILGYGAHDVNGEIVRYAVSILNMFFSAFMGKVTNGGAYNPLLLLSAAISGDFSSFLFTIGARIPAQDDVPASIGGLQFLKNIDLSSNKLIGQLPKDLGKLKRLVLLDLSHNHLTGPIPEKLSDLQELQYLIMEDNPLNATIPSFIGSLVKLTVLLNCIVS